MSAMLHRMDLLLDMFTTAPPRKPTKKRWHKAFVTIYCSRAFSSLFREDAAKSKRKISPVQSSNVVIDADVQSHPCLPEIDQSSNVVIDADVHSHPCLPKIGQSSNVVIDADVQSHPCLFEIDQSSLTLLVKEKKVDNLGQLGMVEGLAKTLKTEVQNGICGDADDIKDRHTAFGTNTYHKPPTKGFFHFVWGASKDLIILILLVCAVLSLACGIKEDGPKEGWYDGGSIFVVVFLFITVSAASKFKLDKFSHVSNDIQVEVVRKGRRQHISIFEIVVGDVVCLKTGDQIPADGLFINGHCLLVDESSMTRETEHVKVNLNQNPFLFSGTKVADGYARMLVTSVGMNTTWGEKMSTTSPDSDEQTPLQAQLNRLPFSVAKRGLAVALVVFVLVFIHYLAGNTKDKKSNTQENDKINDAVGILTAYLPRKEGIIVTAITIGVVSIPEGFPLAAVLTLVCAMKRMTADWAMVRRLSACEAMASATVICTDKTGTITMNEMKVTKFWLGQESIEDTGSYSSIAANVLKVLRQGVGLNTNGNVYKFPSGTEFEFSGSPTEKAILSWAVRALNMDMEELKQSCTVLHVEPFNSEKKRSGVLMSEKANNRINVHWKGAPEMILALCSHFFDHSGNIKPLDDAERREFDGIIQGMAASSLRCIAFAHKEVPEEEHENGEAHQKLKENDLILLGVVGIENSCRPGVKKAVEDCQYAKVKIIMITGDDVFTARAIATECGILRHNQEMNGANGIVVKGDEFRNYAPEDRKENVKRIRVMAKSTPSDKLLMVKCLKHNGEVVAVTGDGTNDAPALKEADIGISMGIQGTEVAKQSSDIVILDDNFVSVSEVLKWGKCVYNNIQKFIQLQLTVNVAALFINAVAEVSASKGLLTAVQLLWVNLLIGTLGALALATEQPTEDLMKTPPVGQTDPLITNIMWRNILAQAMYQITVLLILQFRGEAIFNVNKKVNNTMIFNTFVLCQVFNEFNARKLEKKNVFEGLHRNWLFLWFIGITILLQVVMVEVLKRFAGTERLDLVQWGICTGIASISWPIGWLVKCIPVPKKPLFSYLKWQSRA